MEKSLLQKTKHLLLFVFLLMVLTGTIFLVQNPEYVKLPTLIFYKRIGSSYFPEEGGESPGEIDNTTRSNVLFANFLGVVGDNVLFEKDGVRLRVKAAAQNFAYTCTSQEIKGAEPYFSLGEVKKAYFIKPGELTKVISKGDSIIIVMGRGKERATVIASFNCFNE